MTEPAAIRRGAYPGSFNPPTTAHLAIAAAARDRHALNRVDLMVSRRALNKEHVEIPRFEDRIAVLRAVADRLGWLGVVVTQAQLLVDIAAGYDVLVLGADKWHQVLDIQYYGGSPAARDDAVARLPVLAIAPRPPYEVPSEHLLVLAQDHSATSSTAARLGNTEDMAPEAAAFDAATGAWTDPARYTRYLNEGGH